jgi:flagellar basal body-associated protein FliL
VFNYLALDTDTYNFLDGWDAYVIYDAAIYMMTKEESDTRQVQAKFQEVKDMIEKTLNKRMTGPRHVVETDVSEDLILWGTGNAIF